MKCYGCCQCQREHMEDDPLYEPHIMFQSKHGIYELGVDQAILATILQHEAREQANQQAPTPQPEVDYTPTPIDLDGLTDSEVRHYSTEDLRAIVEMCQAELARRG